MKTPEKDLFGEPVWDEKAFPREWVEKQEGAINRRRLEQALDEAYLQRIKTGAFPEDLPYKKWMKFTKFLTDYPDWTP